MRLLTLSAVFLVASTVMGAPLDRASGVQRRQEDEVSSLFMRDDLAYGGALEARSDDYYLESRATKKTPVTPGSKKDQNKQAKAQKKQDAKAEVAKAEKKGGAAAGAQKKADQKAAAQTKHQQLKDAGKEHKNTQGLPNRNDKFTVPAGNGKPERTYTGKDVRKANFGSHIKDSKGDRFGKPFNNNPHAVPGPDGSTKPLPNMNGKGHEHPLTGETTTSQKKKAHKAEPARIISQTDPATGKHTHQGVIAHDQSRPSTHPGANDHFQVHPTRELEERDEFVFGDDLEARADEYELEARSDDYDLETRDDEYELESRATKKTPVTPGSKKDQNKQAKTQKKQDAKAEVAKAEKKGGAAAGAQKKADQKTAAQTKHQQLKDAGKEHKNTQGLPNRNDKFTVPAGNGKPERTYTGKDVRKANFGSQVKDSKGNQFGKPFNNNPHADPGSSGTNKPLPNMNGKGHEHPLTGETSTSQKKKAHKSEPARIITQTDPKTGKHTHQGVIAHDQSRPAGHPGVNDHFQVKPKRELEERDEFVFDDDLEARSDDYELEAFE